MSKFYRALERAEQDQLYRKESGRENPIGLVSGALIQPLPLSVMGKQSTQNTSTDASTGPERVITTPQGINQHLVSLLAPTTFEAEQYRLLRHTLEQTHRDTGALSLIAVSSPAVGDGKTTTAMNLAGAFAQNSETRVLLIDMDLRRPSIARTLGLDTTDHTGLVGAITDATLSLETIVRPCPPFNFSILPAGCSLANPYEVLKSLRLGELLEEIRQSYDYVVIDTPPLLPFPDCRLISRWVDGFLVVVRAHTTPRKLVEEATNAMDPSKIIGLVFNSDDQPVFGYYRYYDYAYPQSTNGRKGTGRVRHTVKKIANLFRTI